MPILGIDLGTTNSAIAVWRNGRPEILAGAAGDRLVPSVVGLDDDGRVLVGPAAWERLITHPESTAATFKRRMGTDERISLGKQTFAPEELSALVLRTLVADASRSLGEPVTEAVISVPAYFSDAQRRATKVAGELAGLRVDRLINEPTAAAIAYGLSEGIQAKTILVVDLGGGTLDVSLLEFFEGVMEVHATAGDTRLGGEDFDAVIIDAFIRETGSASWRTLSAFERAILKRKAMRAKHELSTARQATIDVQRSAPSGSDRLTWTIERDRFEALAEPLLARMRTTIERAIRDARIAAASIDDVVLVGGATRMPMVRALVARLFGRLPLSHINPDEVVALGACVQAALKARHAALEDVVLTDVAPYTLGIETARAIDEKDFEPGHFHPIIERNSRIPVSRVTRVNPIHRRQKVLRCDIYQGESRLTRNNVKLGSIDVPLPNEGKDAADVRFTYDVNGILEVELSLIDSDVRRRLVINQGGHVLEPAEIEASLARLAAMKVHPRDQEANRQAIARAERIYEEALGEDRSHIGAMIDEFEDALATQDPALADEARRVLDERLAPYDRDIF
jgi:molecular chaperone HscC